MPHYMFRWRYTGKSVRSICASSDDRTHLVQALVDDFKGKLICHYYRIGEFHGLLIAEFPSNQSARACGLYCTKTGGFAHFEVLPLLTAEEAEEAVQIAHGPETGHYIYHSDLPSESDSKSPELGN